MIFEDVQWTQVVTIVIAICNVVGLPVLAGLIINDLYKRRKDNSEKAKQKRAEEMQAQLRTVVCEETKDIKEDISILKTDTALTKEGLQASLRHELYEIANEYTAKKYCPKDVKDDFENMYQKYHILGENGVMTRTREEVLALPLVPPRKRVSSSTKKNA